MSMTIKEAIKHFEVKLEGKKELLLLVAHNPYAVEHLTKQYEADEMALDALRSVAALQEQEERENPKPLTIEELKQVDICPVYVVPLDHDYRHYGGWCVFYGGPATAAIPGVDHWDWELVDYGETWIAYRHKPPKGE